MCTYNPNRHTHTCKHKCICIHTYMHTYKYTYPCICISIYLYLYPYLFICVCVCTHTYTYRWIHIPFDYPFFHLQTCMYLPNVCIYSRTNNAHDTPPPPTHKLEPPLPRTWACCLPASAAPIAEIRSRCSDTGPFSVTNHSAWFSECTRNTTRFHFPAACIFEAVQ